MKITNYLIYYKPITLLQITNNLYLIGLFFLFLLGGSSFYLILMVSPVLLEQNFNYKIIFLHLPLAWFAISLYILLAICSLLLLLYKHPIFYFCIKIFAYVGTIITFLTLFSGSFWGFPMWGSFWVWDARLTSVLVLFILFLVSFFFNNLKIFDFKYTELSAIVAIFGLINIPIIK